MRAFVLVFLLATNAHAASIVLEGPQTLEVGQTADYQVGISLDPGEQLTTASFTLLLDGARQLASVNPLMCDCHDQRGFFSSGYSVDYATYWDPFNTAIQPVLLEGSLDQPAVFDEEAQTLRFLPPYTAKDGPFIVVEFTLTATKAGEIRLIPLPGAITIVGSIFQPEVSFGVRDSQGQLRMQPIPVPDGGAYASIMIEPQFVPEPASALLALLGLGALLKRQGSYSSSKHRTQR